MSASVATIERAGVGTGQADLWCTYAAVRTLSWLDATDRAGDTGATLAYLRARQNADGGYAWSRGMLSDAWATFYCVRAIEDLGAAAPRPDRTADWLAGTFSGDAYAMLPGQEPDVWATHFSTRVVTESHGDDVPDRPALLAWLGGLQAADGGLSWSPAHARSGLSDARACHYGVAAWRALTLLQPIDPPWDVAALVRWLRQRQDPGGGFRFSAGAEEPCLWATFRATTALDLLGAAPERPADCVAWIHALRGESGSFVRWAGYPVEDVWAAFCAVGALRALHAGIGPQVRAAVLARVDELACPGGGYTYREPPAAADALSTAAAVLRRAADDPRVAGLRGWLDGCQLPNEGGVMYMPGRGAEVRCTLWALAAGALRDTGARRRVAHWLGGLQNPDGGFGYWEGRGSDLVSTAAATETAILLGQGARELLRTDDLLRFVASCATRYGDGGAGHANVPGGEPTLRAGLQAHRIAAATGRPDAAAVTALLERHRVPGGGFANQGRRMPDLLSTYDAVATADRFGVPVELGGLCTLLARISTADGVAWTPLAPPGGDPLADCLGELLTRRAEQHHELPVVALS